MAHIPRNFRRQRVLKTAKLVFNDGLSTFNVTLRDLSDAGARMQLIFPFPVPKHFDLLIENPNTGKPINHHCELSWQRGDRIGAKFIEALPTGESPPHVVVRRADNDDTEETDHQ
ncbi:MAG: PilZ domain-containing protein [Hyphomonas sp.]